MQHAHALLRGRRSPCSTCASVRSLHAHTAPPSHTESIESAQVLSSMVPCWQSGSTHASPFVSHDCDFFRVPFRSRAPPPTSTTPSSPPPRAFHCHVTAQS